jgi:hypothetical protein
MGSNFVISIKMTPDQDIARMFLLAGKPFLSYNIPKGLVENYLNNFQPDLSFRRISISPKIHVSYGESLNKRVNPIFYRSMLALIILAGGV